MGKSLFFVGKYNLDTESKEIYSIVLDESTGKMEILQTCAQCENPSYLAVSKHVLYVANELNDKAYLTAYHIHPDGSLEQFDRIDVPGAGVCYIALWQGNQYISGACYTTGTIFTCSLKSDGRFDKVVATYQNKGKSVNEKRQTSSHMHSITPDASSKYWVAADLGTDEIFFYKADHTNGQFELLQKIEVDKGEGPRHFAFHKSGKYGYLVTELNNHIYEYKIEDERLHFTKKLSTILTDDFTDENYAAHIKISSNGRTLYVSNRGADTIDVFKLERGGPSRPYRKFPSHGNYPRHFEITESGKFIVIAHQKSNEVVCCRLTHNGNIGTCTDRISVPKAIHICFNQS